MTLDPGTDTRAAGIVSRGVAAIIDLGVTLAVLGALYVGLTITRMAFNPTGFQFPSVHFFLSTAVTFSVTVCYLALCWAVSGCTVGAVVMGVRVLGRRTDRVPPLTALLRAASCVVFPVGLAWVAFDRRRRSIQDRVFGTRVVYVR
ncbi:MAG: RDD family protein [Mycobacterium sp.]